MTKKIIILMLFLALFISIIPILVQAEPSNVVLTLFDAATKESLEDIFVNIEIDSSSNQYYIEKDKDLVLNLEKGSYNIKILAKTPSSDAYEYYSDLFLIVTDSSKVKIVFLHPVGSLYGIVRDNLDNVVAETELNFECSSVISVDYPETSNKFGSFLLDAVPEGVCEISAIHENTIGTASVIIKKGERTNVEIKLDNSLIVNNLKLFTNPYLLALALLFVLLLLVVLIIFGFKLYKFITKKGLNDLISISDETKELNEKNKTNKIKETNEPEIKTWLNLGKRANDIFSTLRPNEKKIVLFVAESGMPVHLSKIHHKTGLSKGTLSRNIDSLEQKNIIQTQKEGKVRKISLSPWFLDKN